MLVVKLQLSSPQANLVLRGEICNVSGLAPRSSYDIDFEERDYARLDDYPRWCESVLGLVARCLARTRVEHEQPLPVEWKQLQVDVGIRPGGRREYRPLSMACITRESDMLNIGSAEANGLTRFMGEVAPRKHYLDAWDLAEHGLRVTTFGSDSLPPAVALDVPIRDSGRVTYVNVTDIPEPARSAFLENLGRSARPAIDGRLDKVFSWDWLDFLAGQR